MLKKILAPAALALFLLPALTLEASAQGFGFHFGKHGRHTNVGVSINLGQPVGHGFGPHHHHHRPICRPLPVPRPVWIPGRYEMRCEQVWVPATIRREWRPAVYRTDFNACGHPIQILVCAGHWMDIPVPGHYQTVTRQVWIPGHWA